MANLPKHAKRCCIIVLLCANMLSGCGFRDIDKRFFVVEMALDKGEKKPYKVSLKLAIPSPKMEPGDSKSQIISAEGDSIAETVRRMKSMVDKEFDFGHTKVFILGKPFAEEVDLRHALDWLARRRDIQGVAFLAMGQPDALTVLKVKPPSERLPGNSLILSFTREGTDSPFIVPEYWFDFYRRLRERGKDPYLPVIIPEQETFDISKVAVVAGGRSKLELDDRDTEIFNQLARYVQRSVLKGEYKGKSFEISVDQIKKKYRIVTPAEGQPSVEMHVTLKGEVEESAVSLFEKDWEMLERNLAENQKQRYVEVLEKLRDANVDPVGFGLRYRATRHHPATEWEEWQKIYPRVQFHVHVKVELKGTGIVK
ncbi:Ger(x)C family spore germination protein [Cohnella sp. JJ-181]|uniref:Ger(x)C family spore germination protein n=1 Tax=Cohnella rhizoplanae TaxID=2974897 RepID=UPI0022FF82B9|nr:Ger(x)C family spore germination protein [Cohnella sp. JJ-181]CAI6034910.1 hypothetical protein COHCIP112018_00854 [Cohnella sp. JJ-181]